MGERAGYGRIIQAVADCLIGAGVILTVIAPMLLAVEVGEWATNSEWPGWSLADGLSVLGIVDPQVHWTRAQQMVDIVTELPLTITLFLSGTLLFTFGMNLSEWGLDRSRDSGPRRHAH